MPGKVERELKFTFPPEAAPQVKAALRKETDRRQGHQHLVSSYFDTPDDYLWRHGATLRVRDGGERRVQTLKRARASALERDEVEFETMGPRPDLRAFEKTPLAPLVKKSKLRKRLGVNIGVDVSRDVSVVEAHRSTIEAALDNGQIHANGASLPFGELELELKAGDKDALFQLARRLLQRRSDFSQSDQQGRARPFAGGRCMGAFLQGAPARTRTADELRRQFPRHLPGLLA